MRLLSFIFLTMAGGVCHAQTTTADASRPVQVYILLGQSNMVGLGKVTGPDGSLDFAVKTKKKYPYLIDAAGNWAERPDVRHVRVMVGRNGGMQLFNNEFLKVGGKTLGPEYGIGHPLGDADGLLENRPWHGLVGRRHDLTQCQPLRSGPINLLERGLAA